MLSEIVKLLYTHGNPLETNKATTLRLLPYLEIHNPERSIEPLQWYYFIMTQQNKTAQIYAEITKKRISQDTEILSHKLKI